MQSCPVSESSCNPALFWVVFWYPADVVKLVDTLS